MTAVLVHPSGIGNPEGARNWRNTIERSVPFRTGSVAGALRANERATLERLHSEGTAPFWGAHGRHGAQLRRLRQDDVVVLTGDGRIRGIGRAGLVTTNSALGDALWPRHPVQGSYAHVYSVVGLELVNLPLAGLRRAGISWFQTPLHVDDGRVAAVLAALGGGPPGLAAGAPLAGRADVVRSTPGEVAVEAGEEDEPYAIPGAMPPGQSDLLARLEAMGSTDAAGAARAVRGEQSLLREWLGIGRTAGDTPVQCGLCGRFLPRGLLVAAHVKPRSACSEEERRDMPNVAMAACALGCDALFEAGYLSVDGSGRIVTARRGLRQSQVHATLRELEGRRAPAWSPAREPYFAWHREHRFGALTADR